MSLAKCSVHHLNANCEWTNVVLAGVAGQLQKSSLKNELARKLLPKVLSMKRGKMPHMCDSQMQRSTHAAIHSHLNHFVLASRWTLLQQCKMGISKKLSEQVLH